MLKIHRGNNLIIIRNRFQNDLDYVIENLKLNGLKLIQTAFNQFDSVIINSLRR